MTSRPRTGWNERAAGGAPGRVHVGCSGWQYKSWRRRFYPEQLPLSQWLAHYATQFDTVEVNNTFYKLARRSALESWRHTVPDRFTFVLKASRYLTHLKRLRDPAPPLTLFFQRAVALGRALGPTLYQLPPMLERDEGRLDAFLDALPRRAGDVPRAAGEPRRPLPRTFPLRHALEFRHPSWYASSIYDRLERRGVALCLHDKAGSEIREPFVGPFVYVRFHGPSGRYHGSYSTPALQHWAERLADAARRGLDVYAYFNNDVDAAAVDNARTLRALIGKG